MYPQIFEKQRNEGIKTRYLKISAKRRSRSPFLKGPQDSRGSPRWNVYLRGTKNHENLVAFRSQYATIFIATIVRYERLCRSITDLDLEYNTAHLK